MAGHTKRWERSLAVALFAGWLREWGSWIPDGGEDMGRLDVVFPQTCHRTAGLRYRKWRVSRAVGIRFSTEASVVLHHHPELRETRHAWLAQWLPRPGPACRRRCCPGRICGECPPWIGKWGPGGWSAVVSTYPPSGGRWRLVAYGPYGWWNVGPAACGGSTSRPRRFPRALCRRRGTFCYAGLSFLEKMVRGCQTPWTRCWRTAPIAVVEASVIRASGAVGFGWTRRAARDKLALHSSKAATSASVQVTGWEPLALVPERTSWKGAWIEAALGRKRL